MPHTPALKLPTILLRDAVYLTLMSTQKGRSALAMWYFLRLVHCRNGGGDRFQYGLSKLNAFLPGSSAKSWRNVFTVIGEICDTFSEARWVVEDGDDLLLVDVRGA